jgi:hypothetical protein
MKTRAICFPVLLILMSLFSCSKELSREGANPSGADTFRATIDGDPWTAESIYGLAFTGILTVSAYRPDGTLAMSIAMPENITPGTYALDYTAGTYTALYLPGGITTVLASSAGSLVILENDPARKHIKGTFQFQAGVLTGIPASDSQITDGYFSLAYFE